MIRMMDELIKRQIEFQKQLNNDLPKDNFVSFENVQNSLAHNVYQTIEFQEFLEANKNDRKEELIDYLLFLVNKYIYLGVTEDTLNDISMFGLLYSSKSDSSICVCSALAQVEQNNYISLVRHYTIFKPWKVRTSENCVDTPKVLESFLSALDDFKQMSNIVFDSYSDFILTLDKKLNLNIQRQQNNY